MLSNEKRITIPDGFVSFFHSILDMLVSQPYGTCTIAFWIHVTTRLLASTEKRERERERERGGERERKRERLLKDAEI